MSLPTGLPLAIYLVRVSSPLVVFLTAFSLFFKHSSPPPSPSPVVSVVVASRVPRRATILLLLSSVAFTYLIDGLAFVLYAIFQKKVIDIGAEFNALVGLAAFSGLAALGAWKDVHGVEVWLLKRIKSAVAFSLAMDFALATLLGLSIRSSRASTCLMSSPVSLLNITLLQLILILPCPFVH